MTIDYRIAPFLFGALLLLVGLLGGGFEVRELKLPRVGPGTRIVSSLLGFLLISVGILLGFQNTANSGSGQSSGSQSASAVSPVTPQPAAVAPTADSTKPVNFTVIDNLGPLEQQGLVSEQIAVVIDGRNVGTLTVDSIHKQSQVTVEVPRKDMYNYQLAGESVFDVNGQAAQLGGQGSGNIAAKDGDRFEIEYATLTNPLQLSLVKQG